MRYWTACDIKMERTQLMKSTACHNQEKQRGGKVLIHCRGGISRSATVCLAYLMYSRALRLEDAFDYVRACRHIISPNANFVMQLMQFEAEIRSLGFDRSCVPLPPVLSPCWLESHSKTVFDFSGTSTECDTARSPTEVTPTLSRVSLVSQQYCESSLVS